MMIHLTADADWTRGVSDNEQWRRLMRAAISARKVHERVAVTRG